VLASGERVALAARIGRPYADGDSAWACPVELSPLYRDLADIRGIDSFHAMWLACSLLLKLLSHFRDAGGSLLHHDGSEFPLEAYLAGLAGKP
jgi:hypothetical protein